MHVLYVIHYPVFGGPQNYAIQLRPYLEAAGHRLSVVLPEEPGTSLPRMLAGGVRVKQMPLGRMRMTRDLSVHARHARTFIGDVGRLRRFIREEGVDVVVVTTLVDPQAALAARAEGVATVWQIVGTRLPAAPRNAMMPVVSRLADAVMFNGEALREIHGGDALLVPSWIFLSPVDCNRFVPSADRRAATRRALGIGPETLVVGTVANINPQKGIEVFARAAREIHRERPDVVFVIAGAEYETHRAYAQQVREEFSLSSIPLENVMFLGDYEDCENLYPALDVKVISSVPRSEGTTTTAMESLACGVPVVTTDVGALREIIDEGVTGHVVPPDQPAAIGAAVVGLLDDAERRRAYGAAGREAALARFDASRFSAVHIEAFTAALERARVRGASQSLRRLTPAG